MSEKTINGKLYTAEEVLKAYSTAVVDAMIDLEVEDDEAMAMVKLSSIVALHFTQKLGLDDEYLSRFSIKELEKLKDE